jgi:hypothetical protein
MCTGLEVFSFKNKSHSNSLTERMNEKSSNAVTIADGLLGNNHPTLRRLVKDTKPMEGAGISNASCVWALLSGNNNLGGAWKDEDRCMSAISRGLPEGLALNIVSNLRVIRGNPTRVLIRRRRKSHFEAHNCRCAGS